MRTDAQVFRVIDEEDDRELMVMLLGLAELSAGRIVVSPSPDSRGELHWIARDVLVAMGKRPSAEGMGRNAHEAWLRCHLWAAAEEVTDIFVARAHLLAPKILTRLIELGAATGASVWLIQHAAGLPGAQEMALDAWGTTIVSRQEFVDQWSETAEEEPRSHPPDLFPPVPRDEFTSFRASCRALLSRSDFERVDVLFRETVAQARTRLGATPTPESVLALAREQCGQTSEFEEVLTRLRALQVATFHAGLLLRVDLSAAAAGWATNGPPVSDEEAARRLRWFAEPRRGAVSALASTGVVSPGDLARVTVGEAQAALDDTGTSNKWRLCPAMRPLLRVQLLNRQFEGANTTDQLFRGEAADGRHTAITSRAIQKLIRGVTRETGLLFPGSSLTAGHESDARWAKHAGLQVVGI